MSKVHRVMIHKVQYRDSRGRFVCSPNKACKHRSAARKKPCTGKRRPTGAYIEVTEKHQRFGPPRLEFRYYDPEMERWKREALKKRDYQALREIKAIKQRILDDLIEQYRREQAGDDLDNIHDEREAMRQYEIEAQAKRGAEGRLQFLERVARIEKQLQKLDDDELKERAREAARIKKSDFVHAARRVLKARGYSTHHLNLIAPLNTARRKKRKRRR